MTTKTKVAAEELTATTGPEVVADQLAAVARAMSEAKPDDWIDVGFVSDAAGRMVEGSRLPKLDPLVVDLVEEVGGRITTWAIECPTHGRFPLDVRGKTEAIVVGGRHVEAEHFGQGRLRRSRRRKR